MLLNVKNHTFSYNFFLSCWIMFYVKSYFVLICSLFINIYNFKCLKTINYLRENARKTVYTLILCEISSLDYTFLLLQKKMKQTRKKI